MLLICGGRFAYFKMGNEFFSLMLQLGSLMTHERVLDVGCGPGRLAVPLTKYLDSRGSYEGLDIVPESIEWCQRTLTSLYPNFHFQVADIYNKAYNPAGRHEACHYRFPFDNSSFDFVLLASVFTHMLPTDMENYLSEINRTLKTGGRCLITYFLYNSESAAMMAAGASEILFRHDYGMYRTIDETTKEADVCYDEAYVLDLYARTGLRIVEPIHHGSWAGRTRAVFVQDIIVAVKP